MPKKTTTNKKLATRNKKPEFYAKVLAEAEKLDFETAGGFDGIDDEITLLRVKIKYVLEKDPENVKLIMAATHMLAKLVKTRYNISQKQNTGLEETIGNVLKNYALPLSAAFLNKKL